MTLERIREEIVLEHMASEARGDFEATVATFGHPRYEVVPTGEIHDGPAAVLAFLRETGSAFPDMRFETRALDQAKDAVLVEVDFLGTHEGTLRGLPPTGRAIRYSMCNVFAFEGERLVCERLYFDLLTSLKQVGIARDPASTAGKIETVLNHPITMARAVLRNVRASRRRSGD